MLPALKVSFELSRPQNRAEYRAKISESYPPRGFTFSEAIILNLTKDGH
jgi:hypothetical protein